MRMMDLPSFGCIQSVGQGDTYAGFGTEKSPKHRRKEQVIRAVPAVRLRRQNSSDRVSDTGRERERKRGEQGEEEEEEERKARRLASEAQT